MHHVAFGRRNPLKSYIIHNSLPHSPAPLAEKATKSGKTEKVKRKRGNETDSSRKKVKGPYCEISVYSLQLFGVYLNDIVSQLPISQRCFVVLYADDILIIAPSFCNLQQLVNVCQVELYWTCKSTSENLLVCVSGHVAMLNVSTLC